MIVTVVALILQTGAGSLAVSGDPPAIPTSVSAVANGETAADVSWSGAGSSYRVERSDDGGSTWNAVGTPAAAAFSDAGLTAATTYRYRAVALNVFGESAPSDVATVTTDGEAEEPPAESLVGADAYVSPGDVSALVVWHSVNGATSYAVHRGTSEDFTPGAGTLRHTETGATRQFEDTGLNNGTSYYYKVIASNGGAGSPVLARSWPALTSAVVPQAGIPSVSYALPVDYWFDLQEVSDGSVAVSRTDAHVLRKVITDDGLSVKAPSTTGPNGTLAAHLVSGSSLRFGTDGAAMPGRGAFTIAALFQWASGNGGHPFARYSINGPSYRFSKNFPSPTLQYRTADGTTRTLTLTNSGVTGEWLLGAIVLDPTSGATAYVIRPNGTVISASGAFEEGYYDPTLPLYLGARSTSTGSLEAALARVGIFRSALTQAQLEWLSNSGNGRLYADLRPLPPSDPGPAPFTNLTDHGTLTDAATLGSAGIYYLRPFPLHTWDPVLAASLGDYVWVRSTDHAPAGTPNTQGTWLGFSNSPATLPASWTLTIPFTTTITGAGGGTLTQPETPHLVYHPSDANNRPFYLFFHGSLARSGSPNSQQTCWRSSADLQNWTDEGIAIATNGSWNHTGYAKVYAPGDLPNTPVGEWQAVSIRQSSNEVTLLTTSNGPSGYDITAGHFLDDTSVFPSWNSIFWRDNWFAIGSRVFSVGRGWWLVSPGVRYRAVYLTEIEQDVNGRWLKPKAGSWPLHLGCGFSPGLGHVHDVRAFYENGTLHLYPLRGFYLDGGVQDVRYVTCEMDV